MGYNERTQSKTGNDVALASYAVVRHTTTKLHLEALGLARLVVTTPPGTWSQWHWIRLTAKTEV